MRTARGVRTACLTIALALVVVGCAGPRRHAGGAGVRGGTLQVLSADPDYTLDTATYPHPAIAHAYARTLYSYNLLGPPEQQTVPVPDLADGPAQVAPDRRTYTFRLRAGVRYAPPVNREVTARDFITAIQRLYDKRTPSGGQYYADLIAGAKAFGAGKARRISGLAAPDPHTLRITLDQPAEDLLSFLALPMFAPVPGEYAASYAVGDNYSGHVVGSGPYTLDTFVPGRSIVLVRNPNWDPATDPLRKAWVDRIQVKFGVPIPSIQQAIERFEALRNPAKRLEHQLAQGGWVLEYLGDNARQSIVPQYDSRFGFQDNFSEYHNPAVNRLIDRALVEPDRDRRAAMWAGIDQRIMRDAPMVPLVWERFSFQWASRVHGWTYDPWTTGPDLTAVWLDPPSP